MAASTDQATLEEAQFPELFIGLAGPIGVDMQEITLSVSNALKSVRYEGHVVRVTELMSDFPSDVTKPHAPNYCDDIAYKMDHATALCHKFEKADVIARIAIREIISLRKNITNQDGVIPQKTAYIIRQLKRPAEVKILRQVYGRQFILISAYGSLEQRSRLIESKLRRDLVDPDNLQTAIENLVSRDASEIDLFGQQLRETFHLADVFIDGIDRRSMDTKINRFIQAFFGRTDIAPSKDEYGMYAAKSASLRSSDLSRQVGAAIFSEDGELITQGCNEVPKAHGGTYWDLEEPDHRDVRLGHDPNEMTKREILRDLFQRLTDHKLLSETALQFGSAARLVEHVTNKKAGVLAGADIMELTEYGRVVHAEMCAICDAARLGRSVKGSVLYCTTFPCHNCTKHILAAGIKRVVYMEPYPKSKAKALHKDEIEIERESEGRVSFVPFLGISPFRYRDIFQKGRRKRSDGTARRWHDEYDVERPMIDVILPNHPDREAAALYPLIGELRPKPA